MAKFLNTSGAYAQIEEIVSKAQGKLVLITPFVKMPQPLLDRIRDRANLNVKVVIVCRKEDLKQEEKDGLNQIKNLELRFLKELHAKCFYNETIMVITSLNLYETSAQINREMGILLSSKDDLVVFEEARNEAEFIIRSADLDRTPNVQQNSTYIHRVAEKENVALASKKKEQPNKSFLEQVSDAFGGLIASNNGHCIRCGESIEYNPSKPLCSHCYDKWREYGNPEYVEKFCHNCGEHHKISLAKPLCRSCFKSENG